MWNWIKYIDSDTCCTLYAQLLRLQFSCIENLHVCCMVFCVCVDFSSFSCYKNLFESKIKIVVPSCFDGRKRHLPKVWIHECKWHFDILQKKRTHFHALPSTERILSVAQSKFLWQTEHSIEIQCRKIGISYTTPVCSSFYASYI